MVGEDEQGTESGQQAEEDGDQEAVAAGGDGEIDGGERKEEPAFVAGQGGGARGDPSAGDGAPALGIAKAHGEV